MPIGQPEVLLEALGSIRERFQYLEPLRKAKDVGSLFEGASKLAKKLYFDPPNYLFRVVKDSFEKGLDPEKVENVVENQNFQGIDTQSHKYLRYLSVASIKERVVRRLIREVVRGNNNLDLTQTERVVLLANCDLADEFDAFNIDFQNDIMTNPFYKKLGSMDPKEAKEFLTEKGVLDGKKQYLYVNLVEHEEDGSIEMVPYSVAYKSRVDNIARTMEQMVFELNQIEGEPEAKTYAEYYEAYKAALTSQDTEQHEVLWQDLDRKWLNIKGRMQPIHMMESYSDSVGLRVEPDFALQFLDEREQRITDMAIQTKENMIKSLLENFEGFDTLIRSAPSMENSIVGAFTTLIGGRRLDLRFAGQNIPNRPEVRINGVKIFIDMETMRLSWQGARKLLVKVFGEEYVEANFKAEEIIQVAGAVRVAGHEVGHNAFITEDTRTKMGADVYKDIEEHKADISIITTVPDFLTIEEQGLFLKGLLVADLTRLAIKSTDPSRKPYVNSSLVSIYLIYEAGILKFEGKHWFLDLSPDKLKYFFNKMKVLMHNGIAPAYNEKSGERGQSYINNMFVESDITKRLEEVILN